MRHVRTESPLTVLVVLLLVFGIGGCGSDGAGTVVVDVPDDAVVDVPDDLVSVYRGSATQGYEFYSLSEAAPTWDTVVEAGIFICSERRPALIPEQLRSMLDGGGFQSGTLLTLDGEVVEGWTGLDRLMVTIPAAVSGCTDVALEHMGETPSLLLMVDSDVAFEGEDGLVEIRFE